MTKKLISYLIAAAITGFFVYRNEIAKRERGDGGEAPLMWAIGLGLFWQATWLYYGLMALVKPNR